MVSDQPTPPFRDSSRDLAFHGLRFASGVELRYRAIKSNVAESLNIIVQIERRLGLRFVSQVLEIESFDQESDSNDYGVLARSC
jgi:hypothetical protein